MTKKNGIEIHRPKTREAFNELNNKLNRRGFVAIDTLKPGVVRSLTIGDRDPSRAGAEDMVSCIGSGSMSNGPLSKVAWAFDSREDAVVPVTDKDGKPLGKGYVKWGSGDNLPAVIYALSKASPYTAAPLRYLSDLATGLGVRMMYKFEDDTMCEFCNAGYRILQRIEQARKNGQQETYGGEFATNPENGGIVPIGELAPEDRPDPVLKGIGVDYWVSAYNEWKRTWDGEDTEYPDGTERHIPGLREFLENNDLDRHLSQCMHDDQMYDLYFPTVGFEQGRRGSWDPRIVNIGFLPVINGIRYEVMNEHRHIQHIYFGEKFRVKGMGDTNIVGSDRQDVTMYTVAESNQRLKEWRYIVQSNQRTAAYKRPLWVVCPIAYGNRNYYQQPDWWSIFTSKAYDFSSTILYDKAKQRENNTSWGRILYISLDYLDQVFAGNGYQGDKEKQQQFIEELEQQMEQFLQHRDNHGKMMRQWMWLGQDGKEHHNVEIVDIADAVKDEAKAGKEELELSTNPIFLAFGVDPRDVGVPMVSASNGGTALREIRLMKQQLLNVRQRAYIRFLQQVMTFNGFDSHLCPVIMQQTFTTLDRNPTGLIETIAGQGA